MNDFREYSAAFHAQNDDVFHYGTKGMHWDPSKRKKNTSEEDDKKKKKQAVVNATDSFSKGVSSGSLGLHLLKGLYDVVPKKIFHVLCADDFNPVMTDRPDNPAEHTSVSTATIILFSFIIVDCLVVFVI